MGKLLRALVIVIFFLSAGVLVLGSMLFWKRELLKGRTQMLERHVIALTEAYIEDKQAEKMENAFPGKDIEECTPNVVENPKLSTFWDTYKLHLEKTDLEKTKVSPRKKELMTYYKLDPVKTHMITGQPLIERDEFGQRKTEGPGTMHDLLQEIMNKAAAQYQVLNETRTHLREVREELVRTIEELNGRKKELRLRLAEIVQLKKEIEDLKAKIRELEAKIRDLEEQKRALEEKVAEQEKQIKELEEQKAELLIQVEELKKEIKRLKEFSGVSPVEMVRWRFEPGTKGRVAAVNPNWNFVVIELTDQFLEELAQYKGATPLEPELMVKRVGREGEEFITKIKVTQIKKSRKLAIADILTDWQQKPVQPGDMVAF